MCADPWRQRDRRGEESLWRRPGVPSPWRPGSWSWVGVLSDVTSVALDRNSFAALFTLICGSDFSGLNCWAEQFTGDWFILHAQHNFKMFVLRWVCRVLALFPWPLWRKIRSSPHLHFSALLTCCQHWANTNSSQSLSRLPARCPQQGGCFENVLHCWVYWWQLETQKFPLSVILNASQSQKEKDTILGVTPQLLVALSVGVIFSCCLLTQDI